MGFIESSSDGMIAFNNPNQSCWGGGVAQGFAGNALCLLLFIISEAP